MTAPLPAPEQTRTPGAAEQAPVVPGAPVIKKTERPHPATPLIGVGWFWSRSSSTGPATWSRTVRRTSSSGWIWGGS